MWKPEVNSCTVGGRDTIFQQIHYLNAVFDLVAVGKPLCTHRWEGSKTALCDQIVNTYIRARQMTDFGSYV